MEARSSRSRFWYGLFLWGHERESALSLLLSFESPMKMKAAIRLPRDANDGWETTKKFKGVVRTLQFTERPAQQETVPIRVSSDFQVSPSLFLLITRGVPSKYLLKKTSSECKTLWGGILRALTKCKAIVGTLTTYYLIYFSQPATLWVRKLSLGSNLSLCERHTAGKWRSKDFTWNLLMLGPRLLITML